MHLPASKLFRLPFLFALAFCVMASSLHAENFYVSQRGDDFNPGTQAEPFRTVSHGALSMVPGDCLFILPGVYRDEGEIQLRFVTPAPDYFYKPLVGSPTAVTRIIGVGRDGTKPKIFGHIDVRGSYINISNLELIGDKINLAPGIGVYESHNILIKDCSIYLHGGNGIAFNLSDIVYALDNRVGFNAFENPNQSSGISLYQNVRRTDSNQYYGAVISGNICVRNENTVPPSGSQTVTDGNGIIVDDFQYTQNTGIIQQAMTGFIDSDTGTGVPSIEFDIEGEPISYSRFTLVKDNVTLFNGGRGIHVFKADNVHIYSNLSYFNLNSTDLTDGLPRDQGTNDPFFVYGEINLTNSQNARVRGNIAFTDQPDAAGAAEQFFDFGDITESNNLWWRNSFRNRTNADRDVDVFGVDSSLLSGQGR